MSKRYNNKVNVGNNHTARHYLAIAATLLFFLIIFSHQYSYSQEPTETPSTQTPVETTDTVPATTDEPAAEATDTIPATTDEPAVETTDTVPETTDEPPPVEVDTTQSVAEQVEQAAEPPQEAAAIQPDIGYVLVADDTVGMSFYKYKTVHSPDEVYSNILKIENNTGKRIAGNLEISVPDGWKLLTPARKRVSVSPGKEFYLPVRLLINKKSKGDVGYVLQAVFKSAEPYRDTKKELMLIKNSYVAVPKITDWRMTAPVKMINVTQMNKEEGFILYFENNGNSEELIRIKINAGEKLNMFGAKDGLYISELNMEPNTDTILNYSVKYTGKDIGDDYMGWKGSSIRIEATTKEKKIATTVWFKFLKSSYTNELNRYQFPLNVELTARNLLSSSLPAMDLGAWGTVLLPKQRAIEYRFRNNNIAYFPKGNTASDYLHYLWVNTLMTAGYTTKNAGIYIGDNGGVGRYQGGYAGRGISGYYRFKKHEIGASVGKHVMFPLYGASLGYSGKVGPIGINSGFSYTIDETNKINTATGGLGTSFTIMGKHSFNTDFTGSMERHNYNDSTFKLNDTTFIKTDAPDTALLGYTAGLGYSTRINKLGVQINGRYGSKHASPQRGFLTINANINYLFTKSFSTLFIYNRSDQNQSYFTYGKLFKTYFLSTEQYRLLFTKIINSKYSFNGGVSAIRSGTEKFDPFLKKQLPIGSTSGNLDLRFKYAQDRYTSLSPYIILGYTKLTTTSDSILGFNKSELEPFRAPFFNAQAGFYLRFRYMGVNVSYFYGAYSLFSQINYVFNQENTKTLRIMPYFEKFFFNDKFKVSANAAYMYMAFNRTKTLNLNMRLEYYVKNGWRFHTNAAVSSYSRYNKESADEVVSKSFYFDFGVRKSFNIPQPRVKYYDLKVICFKDINGNRSKDDNEAGFDYVLVKIDVDESDSGRAGVFRYMELVTDPFGEISYFNIPEGKYKLTFIPLKSLKDYHLEDKDEMQVAISQNTTLYVPFIKSNKVQGKIVLLRDEFSQLGAISLGEVKVTAFDTMGNQYTSLTEKDGSFTIYVPQSGLTKVRIYNVFGDNVTLERDEFIVDFNGFKEFEVVFKFKEKARGININGATGIIPKTGTFGERTVNESVTPPEEVQPATDQGSGATEEINENPAAGNLNPANPAEPLGSDAVPAMEAPSISWEEVTYYVVIGSYNSFAIARTFLNGLDEKDNILIIQSPVGMYRVVYGYRNESEARANLTAIRSRYPAAWVTQKLK